MSMNVEIDRIVEAADLIPRPFIRTAQYHSEGISRLLGLDVILKIETTNPVGSVMGRSAEWWFTNHPNVHRVVCASANDFGMAMAHAGRSRGIEVELFGPLNADTAKVEALRHAGTTVRLDAEDPEDVTEEARRYASIVDGLLVLDGEHVELVEGAATMAAELEHLEHPPDAVFVPLGSGTLALGTATWCHARMPRTRVVGVAAEGAPAMVRSVRERRVVTTPSIATSAAELAVRVPSEAIVAPLGFTLDDTAQVTERHMHQAAAALAAHEGLRVSLHGAAALAAVAIAAPSLRGSTVVAAVTSRMLG